MPYYNYGNYQANGMNNGYSTGNGPQYPYTPQYYPNQQYAQAQMPMNQMNQSYSQGGGTQGFVWVQGEAGAKAYPVAAGVSVLLMDSEAPVLYMKSTDASGRPLPIETYDLVKRETVVATQGYSQSNQLPMREDMSQYVKTSDLEAKVEELVNKALEK